MTGVVRGCCVEGRRRVTHRADFARGGSLPVCLSVKPVGEPDALIGHVRFDERGWETERCRMAQATAPILDSTFSGMSTGLLDVCLLGQSGHRSDARLHPNSALCNCWPCEICNVVPIP